MKMDMDVKIGKIGLDEETARIATDFIEMSKAGSKKTYRFDMGDEVKSVMNGFISLGILITVSITVCSIFKTIYSA